MAHLRVLVPPAFMIRFAGPLAALEIEALLTMDAREDDASTERRGFTRPLGVRSPPEDRDTVVP